MKYLCVSLACLLTLLGTARAEETTFVCEDAGVVTSTATDPLVVARLVFISFPGGAQGNELPTFADAFATELADYIAFVSNGHQLFDVEVVKRVDDPTLAWVADHPASYYTPPLTEPCQIQGDPPNFGTLNKEIAQEIYDSYEGDSPGTDIWNGVEVVFYIHYESTFGCPGVGGYASPGFFGGVPGYTANGSTQRFVTGVPDINQMNNQNWIYYATVHEYGHLVFSAGHTPYTAGPGPSCGVPTNPSYVNMGRYDAMRANGSHASDDGMIPYHPYYLVQAGWVSMVTVDEYGGDQTLTIPDVRDPSRAEVYRIEVPGSTQWFLLANHQGTGFDARYEGTGLLIWHMWPGHAWDLESAAGKFTGGAPDPVTGLDPLEADWCHVGSADDFFDGGANASFTCTTNPNANLYDTEYGSQPIGSTISLTDMRPGASSDMLVDVSFAANQPVIAPNGGENYAVGETLVVQWEASACAASVDVHISNSIGGSFTPILTGLPNTGSAEFVVTQPYGNGYKIRVVTHLTSGATVQDDSDAGFVIWTITDLSGSQGGLRCPAGLTDFIFTWTTTRQATGYDTVELLPPTGAPIVYTGEGFGSTHYQRVPAVCQVGTWTYRVTSVRFGSTAISPWQTLEVDECLHCPPSGCRPSCELSKSDPPPDIEPFLAAEPNPFNPATNIRFHVLEEGRVSLVLYDVVGREVRRLADATFPAGTHVVRWDGRDEAGRHVAGGVYLVRLQTAGTILTHKLALIK